MKLTRIAVVAVTLSAVVAGPAVAAADPGPAPVINEFTPQQRAEALEHWTPERMDGAAQDEVSGDTGPLTQEWEGEPIQNVGRLFFTKDTTGEDSYCTATSVGGPEGDTVLTAAHCLTRPGTKYGAYQDLAFAPGYHDGIAPFGVFPVRVNTYPQSFTTTDQAGYDIGVVKVDPVAERSLRDTVGAQEVDLSGVVGADVTVFGYPMTRPQLGQKQLFCESAAPASPTEGNLRTECDMRGGASGGPWFRDFDPASRTGTLVSVTSAGVGHLDGPILDDTAVGLFDAVAAG
ncbi:peptidase [Amycolatopsis antarctica]|uniref:Peptidase n=1 Tax=Amycolatopsis antarctica TaxID=1854586 RepID=A0A263D1S4_9PSEU|nr:trypsin-like peptidase domain-containing protein [Amycolatopsis antarctica]OZM71305.1 peptidase [Amycolatopsis antarctica]